METAFICNYNSPPVKSESPSINNKTSSQNPTQNLYPVDLCELHLTKFPGKADISNLETTL